MKLKMKYIYSGLFILIVLTIIYSINTRNNSAITTKTNAGKISQNAKMPNDDIHGKLNSSSSPSKNNVSKSVIHEMEMLKKHIDKVPTDTVSVKKYAELLFASHKHAEAIDYYKQILKIDKKRKDIYLDIVFAYYQLKDLKNAEYFTKELVEYFPNDLSGQYNLGAIYASEGRRAEASKIWNLLIDKFPNSKEATLAKTSLEKLNK